MRGWFCLALLVPCLAQAQIYRWTDEQGRVQFGQHPPAHAEQLEVKAQVIERDQHTREREERSERFFDARREERAQAQQEQRQQRAEEAERCAVSRHTLARISHGGSYFRQSASGEREYFSDDQVQAARRQWQQEVERYCK